MEQSVLALLSELPGLQAAQKTLGERIDYIQRVAMGKEAVRLDRGTGSGTAQAVPVPRKAPVSKAKLDALAKARAAKAQQRQATATGKQAGRKAGRKNGGKRQVAKKRTQTVAAGGTA